MPRVLHTIMMAVQYACEGSALILCLLTNLSPEMDSATVIACMARKFWPSVAAFAYYGRFLIVQCACAVMTIFLLPL